MPRANHFVIVSMCLTLTACAGPSATVKPRVSVARLKQQQAAAEPAVGALRAGEFASAETRAVEVLQRDPANVHGHVVRAITGYKKTMHQLSTDLRTVVFGGMRAGGFNHRYMRSALQQAEADLAQVEQDLAAAVHPDLALELCLACWEVDWNHNGRVDRADRALFQIERDARGASIPEDDPRRRPTFRFDQGDVAWGRAFVSFQRAALDLILAFDWSEVDRMVLVRRDEGKPTSITFRMTRPELVARARERILEGLDRADETRRAYLAETDDDGEWVPNPRQKNHPMPLPVDGQLYRTWELVIGDMHRLVRGEEGLSVERMAQLGDHQWEHPPRGFINIGRMLSKPKDITFQMSQLSSFEHKAGDVEGLLRNVLGDYYVQQMKPSPITLRLSRMKREVQRGEETMERKLRYLFWLN